MIYELANTTGAETSISRDTYPTNAPKYYETVITREGKAAVDAEINEIQDIMLNERLELTRDLLSDGVIVGDAFGDAVVRNSFNVAWNGTNVTVAAGRARIAQRRCDLLASLSSGTAGNALTGFVAPSGEGNYKYIYVDVFRREYDGDLGSPNVDATASVKGNDQYLADPTLSQELARRIQWWNANTDIKATAQNVAVPAAATGHTIITLAKLTVVAGVVTVTDLRPFLTNKRTGLATYDYLVKLNGTVGTDCTHTTILDALTAANAAATSSTPKVVAVMPGLYPTTAALTVGAYVHLKALEASGNSIAPKTIIQNAAGIYITVTANVNSTVTGFQINAGATSAVAIVGSSVRFNSVRFQGALAVSSGVLFIELFDCFLSSTTTTGADVSLHRCWINSSTFVAEPMSVAATNKTKFYACKFTSVTLTGGIVFSSLFTNGTYSFNDTILHGCTLDPFGAGALNISDVSSGGKVWFRGCKISGATTGFVLSNKQSFDFLDCDIAGVFAITQSSGATAETLTFTGVRFQVAFTALCYEVVTTFTRCSFDGVVTLQDATTINFSECNGAGLSITRGGGIKLSHSKFTSISIPSIPVQLDLEVLYSDCSTFSLTAASVPTTNSINIFGLRCLTTFSANLTVGANTVVSNIRDVEAGTDFTFNYVTTTTTLVHKVNLDGVKFGGLCTLTASGQNLAVAYKNFVATGNTGTFPCLHIYPANACQISLNGYRCDTFNASSNSVLWIHDNSTSTAIVRLSDIVLNDPSGPATLGVMNIGDGATAANLNVVIHNMRIYGNITRTNFVIQNTSALTLQLVECYLSTQGVGGTNISSPVNVQATGCNFQSGGGATITGGGTLTGGTYTLTGPTNSGNRLY